MGNSISLLVGLRNNLDYNKYFYETTRRIYPSVEICFTSYGSTDGTHEWLDSLEDANVKYFYSIESKTFSDTFNKCAELATGEYIAYLHNDIVLAPNFLENIEKHLTKNTIVGYTTIEPPIFLGHERPGKLIQDFGRDLESMNLEAFYEYSKESVDRFQDQVEEGATFFMCMPRVKYLAIGGLDNLFNPMFCEDDDLLLRWKLAGCKMVTSLDAICYHFVSKTSRFSEEYENNTRIIEEQSNKNFIRKWGFRNSVHMKKYDIGFIVNGNYEFIEALEPWCSNIYINDPHALIIGTLALKEQPNTSYNLSERVIYDGSELKNGILVKIDQRTFTQEDFQTIQQLSDIIYDSGEIGRFNLGNLEVEIRQMNNFIEELIVNR